VDRPAGCAEVLWWRRSPSRLLAGMERGALLSGHGENSTTLHNHRLPHSLPV
jgi:hypothetical protein